MQPHSLYRSRRLRARGQGKPAHFLPYAGLLAGALAAGMVLKRRKKRPAPALAPPSPPPLDPRLDGVLPSEAPAGLDSDQAAAWASPYEKVLVCAGAGAGKTRLAVERAKLLVQRGVAPDRLLFLTFTREATKEMRGRLADALGPAGPNHPMSGKEPRVQTIHSFAGSLVRKSLPGIRPVVGNKGEDRIAVEGAWKQAVRDVLDSGDRRASFELAGVLGMHDLAKVGTHYEFDEDNPHGEGTIPAPGGIQVRSKAERTVVEELVRRNEPFEYERQVIWADFPFRPDFYLPRRGLFLEYLGLWNHEVPRERFRYQTHYYNKLAQFNSRGLERHLVALYPGQLGSLARELDSMLAQAPGPGQLEMAESEALNRVRSRLDVLAEACHDIRTNLVKNAVTPEMIPAASAFKAAIGLIGRLGEDVDRRLRRTGRIEYESAIALGPGLVHLDSTGQDPLEGIEYVFLDEFQDVYPSLFAFLHPMLTARKYFAIGDERQAIYGFLGGSPKFIRELPQRVPGTVSMTLRANYRSTPQIVEASESVLPAGTLRTIASKPEGTAVELWELKDEKREAAALLERLAHEGSLGNLKVLGRFQPETDPVMATWAEAALAHGGEYFTFHGSKGLEGDTIVVIGLVQGSKRLGFPLERRDHPILWTIKKAAGQEAQNLEDQRLFYVALSRAKNRLVLVTEKGKRSPLLRQLKGVVERRMEDPERCPEPSRSL